MPIFLCGMEKTVPTTFHYFLKLPRDIHECVISMLYQTIKDEGEKTTKTPHALAIRGVARFLQVNKELYSLHYFDRVIRALQCHTGYSFIALSFDFKNFKGWHWLSQYITDQQNPHHTKEAENIVMSIVHNEASEKIIRRLVLAGFSLAFQNEKHKTPLIEAVTYSKSADHIKFLLDYGADKTIDWQDTDGKTALFYAVRNRSAKIIELLLKKGSNNQIRDIHNKMAVDYADKDDERNDAIKALLEDDQGRVRLQAKIQFFENNIKQSRETSQRLKAVSLKSAL